MKAALARLDLGKGVDKRSTAAMQARLKRARRATPEALLPLLSAADLRGVCGAIGVDARGRKRELVERLLHRDDAAPGANRNGPRKAHAVAAKPQSRNRKAQPAPAATESGVGTGYETELWAAANALRGSMDAAEYKHVVWGSFS